MVDVEDNDEDDEGVAIMGAVVLVEYEKNEVLAAADAGNEIGRMGVCCRIEGA